MYGSVTQNQSVSSDEYENTMGTKKPGSFPRLSVVIWLGLEPRTLSLKGRCSTN